MFSSLGRLTLWWEDGLDPRILVFAAEMLDDFVATLTRCMAKLVQNCPIPDTELWQMADSRGRAPCQIRPGRRVRLYLVGCLFHGRFARIATGRCRLRLRHRTECRGWPRLPGKGSRERARGFCGWVIIVWIFRILIRARFIVVLIFWAPVLRLLWKVSRVHARWRCVWVVIIGIIGILVLRPWIVATVGLVILKRELLLQLAGVHGVARVIAAIILSVVIGSIGEVN